MSADLEARLDQAMRSARSADRAARKQATPWFDVSKDGLGKLAGRRGKVFVLHELLQNAWDTDGARRVEITLKPVAGRPLAELSVVDDDPDGFKDLTHSYTLFAESEKKALSSKRGRFNLGEKLVLALCEEALIVSTTGGVHFDREGGRRKLRSKRERGTEFLAKIRMTREELEAALAAVQMVIPPANVTTVINGAEIKTREPIAEGRAFLMTEAVDKDGIMHRPYEHCAVRVYRPLAGEKPHLYEMGIPVMELPDDAWHMSVEQKVPLSMERDAVTPYYLQSVRAEVLAVTSSMLDIGGVSASWVTDALGSHFLTDSKLAEVIQKRFGDKAVVADPSDHEAENRCKGAGYTVVTGGSLPASVWERVRSAGLLKPAGQVMPSPRPFQAGAPPLVLVQREGWTAKMRWFALLAETIGVNANVGLVTVDFTLDRSWAFDACYGAESKQMTVNYARMDGLADLRRCVHTIIHELAHHAGDHLTEEFDDWLARVGAAAVDLALRKPSLFIGGEEVL